MSYEGYGNKYWEVINILERIFKFVLRLYFQNPKSFHSQIHPSYFPVP